MHSSRLLPCAATLLVCAISLVAQSTTASLGGTISDATGASISEATVTVQNVGTGFTQTTQSDSAGAFLFPRLSVGSYELRVERAGFQTYVQSGITSR